MLCSSTPTPTPTLCQFTNKFTLPLLLLGVSGHFRLIRDRRKLSSKPLPLPSACAVRCPAMDSNIDRPRRKPTVYPWYEFVENLEGYCSGGYHPTHLGDIFHNRYKVIHKLGYGSYSVVWLARDLEGDRNVALKILMAHYSQTSSETKVMRALNEGNKDHPGYPFVSHLLDEFWFDGPNGHHLCLVLRASRVSVGGMQEGGDLFPLTVARSISAQVLFGLDYIHSCGVVHGDLHNGNILLQRPELEHFTEKEVVEHLQEPERFPMERLDKKPIGPEAPDYCVPVGMIGINPEDVPTNATVAISDFGQSFFATEDREALQTPPKLAPPEHFFKGRLGPPVDVWTLGMTLYEILSTSCLCEVVWPDPDAIIADMVEALGRPPPTWWETWEMKNRFFAEDGSRIRGGERPLSLRLEQMRGGDEIGEDERKSIEELLKGKLSEEGQVLSNGMLEYDPSKRLTATAAVMSDWMIRWAQPDFQKSILNKGDKDSTS